MRLKDSELNEMNELTLKSLLHENEFRLHELYQLENKQVAFYNREVHELQFNIYVLKLKIKEIGA